MECKSPVGPKSNKLDELIDQLKKEYDDGCAKSDIEKLKKLIEKLDNLDDKLFTIFYRVFFGNDIIIDIIRKYKVSFLGVTKEDVDSIKDKIEEIFDNHDYGNHRKYCTKSFDYYKKAVKGFLERKDELKRRIKDIDTINKNERFDSLFKILKEIPSFGRTACWDFLEIVDRTILNGKLSPQMMYLQDSTGPKKGVMYFFEVNTTTKLKGNLEEAGMEILKIILNSDKTSDKIKKDRFLIYRLEDALCIFQKGKFQSGT